MKKTIALVLAFAIILCVFAGCMQQKKQQQQPQKPVQSWKPITVMSKFHIQWIPPYVLAAICYAHLK